MTVRAKDAELTAERIVDAMLARLASTPYEHIRIEDVATDAGVTGQTVIRRFGSKPALMNATVERELARIVAAREAAAHASAVDTIRDLVLHYERYGALILKTYSEAPLVPGLPEITARGRAFHVDWCRRAFTLDPSLPERSAPGGARRSSRSAMPPPGASCDSTAGSTPPKPRSRWANCSCRFSRSGCGASQ